MLLPSFLGPIALVVYFLCGAALSYRLPVDEVFRNELRKKEFQKKDLICSQDDLELSFQQYTEDSVPFCSTYLSIGVVITTVSVTSRTSACPSPKFMPIC